MKATKIEIIKLKLVKEYGKTRCLDVTYFVDRLNTGYGFPYSDKIICEMMVDFKEYTNADLMKSLEKLRKTVIYGNIDLSDIEKACKEAKADRIRKEKLLEVPPRTNGCPMPADIKKQIENSLSK